MLPPFSKLLLITVSSESSKLALDKAKAIKHLFYNLKELKVLGPIPAQIFYINKKYRFKLLVKSMNPLTIQNYLISKRFSFKESSKVKVKLDIDPYNLY